MKKLNKLIALLCTFTMVVSVLPAAFADGESIIVIPGEALKAEGDVNAASVNNYGEIAVKNGDLCASSVINSGNINAETGWVIASYLENDAGEISASEGGINAGTVLNSAQITVKDNSALSGTDILNYGEITADNSTIKLSGELMNFGSITAETKTEGIFGDIIVEQQLSNLGTVKTDVVSADYILNQGIIDAQIVDASRLDTAGQVNADVVNVIEIRNGKGFEINADKLNTVYLSNNGTIKTNELDAVIIENAGTISIQDDVFYGLVMEYYLNGEEAFTECDGIGTQSGAYKEVDLDKISFGEGIVLSGIKLLNLNDDLQASINGVPVQAGEMLSSGMLKYLSTAPTHVKMFWDFVVEQHIEILLRWVDDDIKQVLDEDGNEMVIDEDYWHVGITNFGSLKLYFTGEQLEQMEAGEYNYTIVTSDGVEHPYCLVIG